MRPLMISTLALSFALAFPASAEDGHKHLGAHEHGAGELMVVFEGNDLLVEFRLPGMDTVGFEHTPETQEQHETVDAALDKLKAATNVVDIPAAAKCSVKDAHVTSPFKEEMHKEDEHGHEEEHDHEEHSEFLAAYHFHCEAPQNLGALSVNAFTTFPTLEDIDYQVVGPNRQMGGELEAHNTQIAF